MTNKDNLRLTGKIFATGIMSFCGVVSETAMNVTFPALMKEFSVGTSTVQWITTGYLLVLSLVITLLMLAAFVFCCTMTRKARAAK